MPDLKDGESVQMQGSGSKPYDLKNTGGVYSCSCPAWRNQSVPIERRTCKHLRKLRGSAEEDARVGAATTSASAAPASGKTAKAKADSTPGLLLAERWDNSQDLAGWWMSEKLDGVRAFWTGQTFLSRQGNMFHAPDWFCERLPNSPLDGELWIDRQAFQRTVSIVRRQDKSDLWREVSYRIFDAPAATGKFEDRLQAIQDLVRAAKAKHIAMHPHELCKSIAHLRQELERIEKLGGEGLMLREPGSQYVAGRSTSLLKVKTFHDAEAIVREHLPGAGRHKGRLGALLVELPDGTQFSVGTGFTDAQRQQPPAIGSTITFRYQELTDRGVPRFPSFVRLRTDRTSRL